MIIRKWKRMELNDHNEIEKNGMYLSKRNEWNDMELSNFDWMF